MANMKKAQQNIGIITQPISKAGFGPLSNLVKIISSFSSPTYVITGNEGMNLLQKHNQRIHILGIQHKPKENVFIRIIYHVCMQLRISFKLIKQAKSVNVWIFFLDSHALLLPVLTAKLIRKKIIFTLAASIAKSAEAHKNILDKVSIYSEAINFRLSDHIILYSQDLIKGWNLEKYGNKISIAHEHLLDFDKFKMQRQLNEREKLVGYVGRLSEEKGVLNFVRAILELSKGISGVEFLIGGDGRLRGEIEKYLSEESLKGKVELPGWIPHDELPGYLNQLKLLVLPSYTEGLPNIMLEAMACGTPILATPVGAIPDIIKEGETGFLMENNSPECIATNVIRALDHPDLEGIAQRARSLVEREFTFEEAVLE